MPLSKSGQPWRSSSTSTALWRSVLIGGCLGAAALGVLAGDPTAYLQSDPDLARVLRGMALIKAALVLLAISAIFWRCSWSLSRGPAAGYVLGVLPMAFATAMIWQLTHLAAAAGLFHLGLFLLLGAAYLDHRGPERAAREGQQM
jgi:hypothetical protein